MTNDKIWRLIPPSPHVSRFSLETGLSPLMAQLLLNRGVSDSKSAKSFLFPKLADLTDPMSLKDIDHAVEMIIKTMESGEQIAVFGDYDADGITSTALLSNFFSELGVPITCYIPNRLDEGYSLNDEAIKKLAKRGIRLIITVDCGISNRKEIELARDLGLKVVITDHHQIPHDFDPICPVINPNRKDSSFPFKTLAGVGVAFFLAIALRMELRNRNWFKDIPEPDLKHYLDLVALGTVADMVPLIDLNRTLVQSGIEVMKNSIWPGIKAIKETSGIDPHRISSHDLAFKLSPRLNAPGRMGDIKTGLRLLTTNSKSVAVKSAHQLSKMNTIRQQIVGDIIDEIEETIIRESDIKDRRTIVLAREGWHKGVLGIVASRLLDRYHRPALVLTIKDGVATGSGRSIDGFNLHSSLTSLDHLFEKYGGHYHAAGCTLKASNIEKLAHGLEELAREKLNKEALIPALDIDADIKISELTFETVMGLKDLEPFGTGNSEPLFYSEGVSVIRSWIVGEKHLKLKVGQGNAVLDAIGFGMGDLHSLEGRSVNMVFTPEINEWNGLRKIQLRINDLEPSGSDSRLVRLK
jgi:single-stranded-DNA-specific exonuclease